MRPRTDSALRGWALVLFAVVVAMDVGYVVAGSGLEGHAGLAHSGRLDVGEIIGVFSSALVGLLLTWARPRNAIGWLISSLGLALGLSDLGQTYGARALVVPEDGLPFGAAAMSLTGPLWIAVLTLPATLLLVRYPSGVVSRRWARRFDRLALVGYLLLYVGYATSAESVMDEVPGRRPPWQLPGQLSDLLLMAGGGLLLIAMLGIIADALDRALRSDRAERLALVWLTLAAVLAFVLIAFGPAEWMGSVAFSAILVAIAVGVLRYQALGIEVVVRRTLIYATLTGLVLLVYVGVVAGLAWLLPSGPTPQLVAAAVIAVGLTPARDRIQGLIDRVLYGERGDPWSALRRLGDSAGVEASLVPDVLAALAGGLHLTSARIEDRTGRELAAWGAGTTDAYAVPLTLGGEQVGLIRLGPRRGESTLGTADLRLLDAVAPLVAAVLRSAAEQTRVLEATNSERGRLRQDLHDGLGPSLTGIGLGLEALQSRATADKDLVARLRVEVSAALEEIRRIIDNLRPSALDDHGLVGALQRRVDQVSGPAGLEVRLDAPDALPDVPPQVELAAFRIADEALTNVVRHAGARHCTVRVSADGGFHLVIADDGRGVGSGRPEGLGLASMRERAERLGGRFTMTALTPGTEVRVELPLGGMS
jgi:signal transduction histidine kinase